MAFFPLSGITGCFSPASGETSSEIYGVKYNNAIISSYYKKDKLINFVNIYMVVVIIGNYTQQFQFTSITDRDTFYATLP